MPSKRVTSQQVAQKAGVSRTTVSLVLNEVEGANISPATRKRVLDAAEHLGYVPNEAARSLVSGQTKTLALIICQATHRVLSDAYFPLLIHGIQKVTRRLDFRLLVDWVSDVTQPNYNNLVRAKKIDGMVLVCPRLDDSELQKLVQDNFPIVILGNLPEVDAYSVDADNVQAATTAVKHLIQLGHKRIACITNAPAVYISADERLQGYQMQLEATGITYDEKLVQYGNFDPESGYNAMKHLLQIKKPPTAVFVASDVVAFGALSAIREHGLQVPQDIAIVGFDDVPMAKFASPPLTTIHLPAIEQGRLGTELLIKLIQGKKVSEQRILLNDELVIRQSCGSAENGTFN